VEKDLKENDIARFLTNLKKAWDQYGNYVLMVALLIALVWAGINLMKRNASSAHESDWQSLNDASNIFEFKKVAREAGSPVVKALALIRGASQILDKVKAPPAGQDAKPQTPQEIEQDLKDAEHLYKQALEISGLHSVYLFHAHMGLGAVAESRMDLKTAGEQYKKAQDALGQQYKQLAYRAGHRIKWLDRLKIPVVIAPDAAPDPTASMRPLSFPLEANDFFPLLSAQPSTFNPGTFNPSSLGLPFNP
jgi:hypothetical protein